MDPDPPFKHLTRLPHLKHNMNFYSISKIVNLNHFLMPFISYKYNKPNELNLNLNLERSQKKN